MTDRPIGQLLGKGARVAAALIAVVAMADLATALWSPAQSAIFEGHLARFWREQISSGGPITPKPPFSFVGEQTDLAKPITRELLTLDLSPKNQPPGTLLATYEAWLPKDHPVVREARLLGLAGGSALVQAAFGEVTIWGPLKFDTPDIEVREDSPEAYIKVRSEYRSDTQYLDVRIAPAALDSRLVVKQREIVIRKNGARVSSLFLTPAEESSSQVRYVVAD